MAVTLAETALVILQLMDWIVALNATIENGSRDIYILRILTVDGTIFVVLFGENSILNGLVKVLSVNVEQKLC